MPDAPPSGFYVGHQQGDSIGASDSAPARPPCPGPRWQPTSLGSTDTLIEHPAGLTHHVVDPDALAAAGVTEGTLRISVGVEDPEDLWDDLVRALRRAGR